MPVLLEGTAMEVIAFAFSVALVLCLIGMPLLSLIVCVWCLCGLVFYVFQEREDEL